MPVLTPDALLCFNIYAASHAFTRFYKPLLDPLGLTYPQYLVMLCLHGQDGQGVGMISDQLHLDTNTLSPLLKRLEAAGLILRVRQSSDERKVQINLTPSGRTVAAAAAALPECIRGCIGLTADEITQASETMRKLRVILGEGIQTDA